MPDFDAWLKGQQTKTPAPPTKPQVPTGGGFESWMSSQAKPSQPKRGAAEAEAALIGPYDPRGYDAQGRGLSQRLNPLQNVSVGAQRGYISSVIDPIASLTEPVTSAMRGDFGRAKQSAKELGELALRGAGRLLMGGNPSFAGMPRANEARISEISRQRAGREITPRYVSDYSRRLEARAAGDPRLSSRVTRGIASGAVTALPAIAGGMATGGSLPAIAAITGAQSAAQPENLALNVGASVVPLPVGKALAPLARRFRRPAAPASAPSTARLSQSGMPNAPPTQEAPSFKQWAEAENAPTGGLPELSTGEIPASGVRAAQAAAARGSSGPRLAEDALAVSAQLPAKPPRTPLLETISAVRKAGLLSGPTTHARNIGGTAIYQAMEQVSRIPSAIADLAVSAVTKQRTVSAPSFRNAARSSYNAAAEGLREARQVLRTGMPQAQQQALQVAEITSGSKIVQGYTRGIFRMMGAADSFFRKMAYNRALRDRAQSLAMTEARQGKIGSSQINQRAKELTDNPPPDLDFDAIADAEFATFNNSNLISEGVQGFKTAIEGTRSGRAVNFSVDMLAPFIRTPSNVLARVLEYSGGGYARNAGQISAAIFRKLRGTPGFTPEQQRRFSQAFGRSTTGVGGLVTLGYMLGEAGYATGFHEDSPSMRARDEAAGRQAGSIYDPITGKWRRIAGFSPIGTLLIIGATLSRESRRDEGDEESSAFGRIAKTGMAAVAEQPLLIGSKEVAESITRPGSVPERAGRLAGSFVPTIVSQSGELTDDYKREAEGFTAQIQRRIPGLRNQLPEKLDALGRPLPSTPADIIDPTAGRTALDKQRPLEAELVRLDLGLSRPQKKKGETLNQYRSRSQQFGQLFETAATALVKSPEYRRLDDDARREVFETLRSELHQQIRGERDNGLLRPLTLIERTKAILARRREKERAAKLKQ